MKKILIIEDDKTICHELESLLIGANYEVVLLKNFEFALEEILEVHPDLILLDINIPFMNGELLLKNLRKKSNVPVIMVTSKNSEADEVLSISYGADDYITKPYNPTLLLLRIGAIFKRMDHPVDVLKYRDVLVYPRKGILAKEKMEVILTKNEMIVFVYLLNNQNRIVSRDELMTDLWNNDEFINDNALTVNMSRLRAKLSEIGYPDAIETRKKVGYILL